MCLNCRLGLILMCVCCASDMVDIEAETAHGTCIHSNMDESCICGHHVSKDFCTPIFNEVCSGSQEGKFWGRKRPRRKSVIARCYYKLELSQLL